MWLGAAGQATDDIAIGTGVTGLVHRYNPVVVAQQIATVEAMFPGRAFLGVGSSEAMNEVPAGMDWPDTGEQLARTEEALTIIGRLLDGETVDFAGEYFTTHGARLYLRPERRPPIFLSAFHEQAAEVAGRLADGVWTLADPKAAPKVIAAYRRGAEEADRAPGEIILQSLASVDDSDDAALEASREWKATLPGGLYTDDIHEPADIENQADDVSDRLFTTVQPGVGGPRLPRAQAAPDGRARGERDRGRQRLRTGAGVDDPALRRAGAARAAGRGRLGRATCRSPLRSWWWAAARRASRWRAASARRAARRAS